MNAAIWFLIGTLIVLMLTALLYAVIQLKDRQNEYDKQARYVAKQVATVDAMTKSRLAKTDEKTLSTQQRLSETNKNLSTKIGSLDDRAMGLAEGSKTRMESNVKTLQEESAQRIQEMQRQIGETEQKTASQVQNTEKKLQELEKKAIDETRSVRTELVTAVEARSNSIIDTNKTQIAELDIAVKEAMTKLESSIQRELQSVRDLLKGHEMAILDSTRKTGTELQLLHQTLKKDIAAVNTSSETRTKALQEKTLKDITHADTALRNKMKTDFDLLDATAAKRISELKTYTDSALKTLDHVTQTRLTQLDARLKNDLNAYREAVAKDMARMATKTDLADMQRRFGEGLVTKSLTSRLLDLGNDDKDRDVNAGKILYRGLGNKDTLDVVGVGKSGQSRKVRVWDQLFTDQVSTNTIYSKDSHADVLDLGFEDKSRNVNAGKITYRKWDKDALEIVGAGKNGQSRRVRVWDELNTDAVRARDMHLQGKLCIDNICLNAKDVARLLKQVATPAPPPAPPTLTPPPTVPPPAVQSNQTQVAPMPKSAFPLTAPTTNTQVQAPVVTKS